jgi:hypothetical protein
LRAAQAAKAAELAKAAAEAQRAAQAAQIVPQQAPAPVVANYSGNLAAWLLALRMCETGGNYATNTGNGYYGAYQFSIATWNHWNTGYARADLAPPAVQDATVIKNTNASQGLSTQHPGCYHKLGLSNKPPTQ